MIADFLLLIFQNSFASTSSSLAIINTFKLNVSIVFKMKFSQANKLLTN